MYSVSSYGAMITDSVRMDAYARALRRVTHPGSVVLDIGTGTGIFALLACQYGARHVYAIEPADAIEVARKSAAANGYGDRMTFFQDLSTRVNLPEQADVIISDLRGSLPLNGPLIPTLIDARQRHLAPGGVMIPQQDTLLAAVAETPELYHYCEKPWLENSFGLDLRPGLRYVTETLFSARLRPNQLLTDVQPWGVLDYGTIESPHVGAELTWTAKSGGTGHGIHLWFETMLMDGIGFSTGPDRSESVYGAQFMPWTHPVRLDAGDKVCVQLRANLVGEAYVWRWDTRVYAGGDREQCKADYQQTTFASAPRSAAQMYKRASAHVPVLNEEGQMRRLAFGLMDDRLSLEEIARRIAEDFPARYEKWQDALPWVGELSEKYSL